MALAPAEPMATSWPPRACWMAGTHGGGRVRPTTRRGGPGGRGGDAGCVQVVGMVAGRVRHAAGEPRLNPMKHVRLGRTGLQVSNVCLGTMTFGLQCDEPTSVAILDKAAEAGVTFLDAADVYPLGGGPDTVGRTEEIIGSWIKGKREQFIVATKCFGR